ncbi:uncharacterized protein SPSK_01486 [Sporothrix schenckii 1099-18]|uniref:Uncharacterized protein n=1 Tax=Sporothrix schenckii 1099-18 TaxID=1397361 RepID=A0A0F2MF80_SPOSC|nr:uncharacterized protein SPSK_01486 [Sporothrix schenckii 1099-18]KJR87480.1 hypothetical protein SPSK_01486 [Sporothrix schenckii 1099-18]
MDSWQFEYSSADIQDTSDWTVGQFPGDDSWSSFSAHEPASADKSNGHTAFPLMPDVPKTNLATTATTATSLQSSCSVAQYINSLPPHKRAKAKAMQEAADSFKADSHEMLSQDSERFATDNLPEDMQEEQETDMMKTPDVAAPVSDAPKPTFVSPKRWIITNEETIRLSDGRTISSTHLSLVDYDDPRVELCRPDESKVVYVSSPFDNASLPPARKEWFVPSPALIADASPQVMDLALPEADNPGATGPMEMNGSTNSSGSGDAAAPASGGSPDDTNVPQPPEQDGLSSPTFDKNEPGISSPKWDNQGSWTGQPEKSWEWNDSVTAMPEKVDLEQPEHHHHLVASDEAYSNDKAKVDDSARNEFASVDTSPATVPPTPFSPTPDVEAEAAAGKKSTPAPTDDAAQKDAQKDTQNAAQHTGTSTNNTGLVTKSNTMTHQSLAVTEVDNPTLMDTPIIDTGGPDTPLMPAMIPELVNVLPPPGRAKSVSSSSSVETAVESLHTSVGSGESALAPPEKALASNAYFVSRWAESLAKYGPTDWHGYYFTVEDPAAVTTPRAITAMKRGSAKQDGANHFAPSLLEERAHSHVPAGDDHTELSADRYRLPTLRAFGKRAVPGFVDCKLRLGAFRFQHDDSGPAEPTGPLQNLRMTILCNFARQCREALHTATAEGPLTINKKDEGGDVIVLPLAPVDPDTLRVCRRCGRAQEFVMRSQHGRLFLETVLRPLSEAYTYADMVAHVNTCVIERIYSEGGMGPSSKVPTGTLWQDIKAMPIYHDYQGALILAAHKRRVMRELPIDTDTYGFLFGRKDRQ